MWILIRFRSPWNPPGEMLPSGLDPRHLLGCLKPLVVPLARRPLSREIHLVRFVPVEDVADDVMHRVAAGRAVLAQGVLAVACRGGPGEGRRARAGGV